ncbi:MAG TPA: hypothetical protein VLC46_15525 [Thermoanaerobaculia bacterium]|nr:hypothetical protein [Thermoanaerobaculia bacterium]
MDVHLSVDEKALASLRPPAPASRIPEDVVRVVQLVQAVAIIVAGVWVYYLYVTFQRPSNQTTLLIASAQLEQAKLELKKATIELGRLIQTPLAIAHQIRVTPVGSTRAGQRLYLASYVYRFTNNGNKQLEVSYVLADGFLAHPPPRPARAIAVNDVTSASPLTWEPLFRRGFNCRDWQPKAVVRLDGDAAHAEHCGGGSGIVKSGETTEGKLSVLVYGRPRDLIQFRARCAIDGATRIDLSDYAPLAQDKQ